jgi:ABC-type Fe3+/spermidine/putrescine transport system ATPase subunit
MSVFDNVAFGLRRKNVDRSETTNRVNEMLELVQLGGKSDRRPRELSGGQQQRVALARALVNRPRALLLDEPLAALDLKLRQAMQLELKRIQREVGITFIFVTHDQGEALTMSDRLVVMNAGRIEQLGSPREVYERPRTRFVADFIGEINVFDGRFAEGRFIGADGRPLPAPQAPAQAAAAIAVRPENLRLVGREDAILWGRIETANYLGGATLYRLAAPDGRALLAKETNAGGRQARAPGDEVGLAWDAADAVMLEG